MLSKTKTYLQYDEIDECFNKERSEAVREYIVALRDKLKELYEEKFSAAPAMFAIMLDWTGFDELEPYRCYCEFYGNIECFNYEKACVRAGGISGTDQCASFVDRDLNVVLAGITRHEIRRKRFDDALGKLLKRALIEVEAEWGNENAEV